MSEHARPADEHARERIRSALGETLLVEAAAGTGKTTELVQRIVNLLATGTASITRLAALTFTEKAAAELKLRVREGLDHARRAGGNPARRANLEAALLRLEEARIDTIHGFCADLLRERPVEAGIDPAFEVLAEPEAARLHTAVFDRWFVQRLNLPPEGLRRALSRRYDAEDGEDEGPVDRLRHAAAVIAEWRDFPAAWRRDPAFNRAAGVDRVRDRLRGFAALSARPERRGDNLAADTAFLREASEDLEDEVRNGRADLDVLEARIVSLAHHPDRRRVRKGSGASFAPGVPRATVLAERDAVLADVDAFVAAADADLAAALRDDLAETVVVYQDAKRRAGGLDFLDLLTCARDLVRDHAEVRAELQARFDALLIDEFQDTDPIQAELLLLLAADDPAVADWRRVRVRPGKLFIVGDPKQSIYRFRRADVGTYEEVKRLLEGQGVRPIQLSTSFRAVPAIQRFVNHAFAPLVREDADARQAAYVPLRPWRDDEPAQPAIVALPVPKPYGARNVSGRAIEESLPDAVGAFVAWLLHESGWTVTERTPRGGAATRVRIEARHVCLLFRRFASWDTDVTRPYVEALEARDVPHLLVGGRSLDDREEVESLKAALAAIEWPEDELSVFATLRGPLFALGDAGLLRWRRTVGAFNPFHRPEAVPSDLADVADALRVLGRLHLRRNAVPVTDTIGALLDATRAHAGLALRPNGEQALANVLHLAELARQYASMGGLSFRGFVEALTEGAFGDEAQAPILEEGGDGVRLMTLHKAKGLEFPVVILCDITANLATRRPDRHLDPARGLCAVKLAGCAPHDLIDHAATECARDRAEGIRIAYVAATRARDLLVVPAVGDEPYDAAGEKWVSCLNAGLYPAADRCREPETAPWCTAFTSRDSVLLRPDGDPALARTVAPGLHLVECEASDGRGPFAVTWWDPHVLDLGRQPSLGLRRTDLIGKDADPGVVAADLAAYERWRADRDARLEAGRRASIVVRRATSRAADHGQPAAPATAAAGTPGAIDVIELPRAPGRPSGPRFGSLVHAALALVPLDADATLVDGVVAAQARLAAATDQEREAASALVRALLSHDLIARARDAERRGACRRETPVSVLDPDGVLVEGQVDLAFEDADGWTVVDFKTDAELQRDIDAYRRQVGIYVRALAVATGRPVRGVLLGV